MSGNPFDDDTKDGWLVVTNADAKYSLWRPHLEVPRGWQTVHSCSDRASALDYVERNAQEQR